MNEETTNEGTTEDCYNDQEVVYRDGVSNTIAATMLAVIVALVCAAGYFATHERENPTCSYGGFTYQPESKEAVKARVDAQDRDNVWRASLAKNCVDRGHIPVIINGNLDCKAMPK